MKNYGVNVCPETSTMIQKLAFKRGYHWITTGLLYIQSRQIFINIGRYLSHSKYEDNPLNKEIVSLEEAVRRLTTITFKGIEFTKEELENLLKEFS